jgi:hypothetical protein
MKNNGIKTHGHHARRGLISAALIAAFASTGALAQQPPKPPAGRPAQGAMEHRPFTKPSERVEARLAYQKTALKITPAQEAQWNAYADFSRRQAREMEQRFDQMRSKMQAERQARGDGATGQPRQRPNAIERMERQQAFMAEASRHLSERIAVQKPLYAALSPDQQKVADQVLNPRGGPGMGGRGGRGERGGRHMHGGEGFARG